LTGAPFAYKIFNFKDARAEGALDAIAGFGNGFFIAAK